MVLGAAIMGLLFSFCFLGWSYLNLLFGSPSKKYGKRKWIAFFSFLAAGFLLFIIGHPEFNNVFPEQFQVHEEIDWLIPFYPFSFEWLLFYIDSIFSVVSFDISSYLSNLILGREFSPITPSGWIGNISVFIFRSLLASGLIQLIYLTYKEYFHKQIFHGKVKDIYRVCQSISLMSTFIIQADTTVSLTGKVTDIVPPLKMTVEEYCCSTFRS